jgi:dipeptidyl aminopeptidase/acylaminoacyl peptidase
MAKDQETDPGAGPSSAGGKPAATMAKDFRRSTEFQEAEAFFAALLGRDGHVFGARGLCGNQASGALYFIGQSFGASFEGGVSNRLYSVSRNGGAITRLNDRDTRQIALSPDGGRLAVACAGYQPGSDRIELWSATEVVATTALPGRIEQMDWAPDGRSLLLVVAGQGADVAGIHGGYAQKHADNAPAWLPDLYWGVGDDLWRRVFVWYGTSDPRALTAPPLNAWDAAWCGNDAIIAITSGDHAEGSWYASVLSRIDLASGRVDVVHTPRDQLGYLRGSPDGRRAAFIEAFCSDRGLVAGQLSILDLTSGKLETPSTAGMDVTSIEWRSPNRLHLAGLRGHETVVADFDLDAGYSESWSSMDLTSGEWAPAAVPFGEAGSLFVAEGYARAPFLAELRGGQLHEVVRLAAPGAAAAMEGRGSVEPTAWKAADGWEIEGWLLRPSGTTGPTPLLVDVHGGPISAHRNRWMARMRAAPLLVRRGWSVLFPNPRGSTGRGDTFVRAVKGDMGGADALDVTSGVDALVARGLVDARRVAVTGTSYGGFMSAWLPTQTDRFAAAIPISPVGDWYSQHRTSQIPEFDELMLGSSPWAPGGAYFSRSPAFFRHKAPVPMLILAGGIDKSTPPGQALECHFAALRSGAPSALLTYPNAGHSVRVYPEYIDSAARILWWLDHYVGASVAPAS